jgi:hypothetical protein
MIHRRTARVVAQIAVALAGASTANAIVTASILYAEDYDRFTPAVPEWARFDPTHQWARAGIARLITFSFVGAAFALALAIAARLLQRRRGALPCRPIANVAIATALAAGVIAAGASILYALQFTPIS